MRASNRLGRIIFAVFLAVVVVSGCTALRPNNDQRMKVADEAAALAQTLRASETDPFAAMEDGISTVATARKTANDYLDANRKAAFLAALPEMTREDLAEELITALNDHLDARKAIEDFRQSAADSVAATLERQKAFKGAAPPAGSGLLKVLDTVEKRLDQIIKIEAKIGKAMSRLKGEEESPNLRGNNSRAREEAVRKAVDAGVDSAREFIDSVRTDPVVQESSRLILQAGLQVTASETERLQEMQRHLQTMQAIQESFAKRDLLYAGELLLPALAKVADDESYKQAAKDLDKSEFAGEEMLKIIRGCIQREWVDDDMMFTQFVKASFAAAKSPKASPDCDTEDQKRWGVEMGKFIASLGVILFYEQAFDSQQAVAAATELHLHSIRLSRINSQQRLDLVGQVTEALRIYYQGGLTPQEAAQMILTAADVLATGAIAGQL